MQKQLGVTLMELMVVIAIIGILAAFAFPAYEQHVMEARRQDGISTILEAQLHIESFITENNANPATGWTTIPSESPSGFYDIVYTPGAAIGEYRIDANAKGAQTSDTGCTNIYITNLLDSTYPFDCK